MDGNGSEAYPIAHRILPRPDLHVIETRALGGPTLGICGHSNSRPSRRVHRKPLLDTEFGDRQHAFIACLETHGFDPARDHRTRGPGFALQADLPTPHICSGHAQKRNLPGQSAIVVPIRGRRRDIVGGSPVVDPDHEQIFSGLQGASHVKVEGREAALVLAEQQTVEIDRRSVVGRAEVEEHTLPRHPLAIKSRLVPNNALVENQARILSVPIAGDRQGEAVLEGKLRQVAGRFGLYGARRKSRKGAPVVGVDHRLPTAIQRNPLAPSRILHQGLRGPRRILGHRA